MPSSCLIDVRNEFDVDLTQYPMVWEAVSGRIAREMSGCKKITVMVFHRADSGFLEWDMVYDYHSGGTMMVGVIQRKVGDKVEFHS